MGQSTSSRPRHIPLSELEASAQTGDLLLYHGQKSWVSLAIERVSRSPYSHVAVLLRDPDWMLPDKGLFILESEMLTRGAPDAEDHKAKRGVQIRRLAELRDELASSTARVFYRRLRFDRSADPGFKLKLAHAHKLMHDRPYDLDPRHWFAAAQRRVVGGSGGTATGFRDTRAFFCSALAAFLLLQLGLIEPVDWSVVAPADFSSSASGSSLIRFSPGVEPVPEVRVTSA
jgi:hypothetical protein